MLVQLSLRKTSQKGATSKTMSHKKIVQSSFDDQHDDHANSIKSNDVQSHEEGFALTFWTNIRRCAVVQNKKQYRLNPQSWNFPSS